MKKYSNKMHLNINQIKMKNNIRVIRSNSEL